MTRPLAVVTGACSGIGAATARRLASEGFEVVCAARRADRIEALAVEIGGRAVVCDVTSCDDVAALAADVGERCDLLVNNAGGAFGADPVAESDLARWRAMYEVNVIGVVAVTKALLPALVASGGQIVVMGSTAGQVAYEGGGGTSQPSSQSERSSIPCGWSCGRPTGAAVRDRAGHGSCWRPRTSTCSDRTAPRSPRPPRPAAHRCPVFLPCSKPSHHHRQPAAPPNPRIAL